MPACRVKLFGKTRKDHLRLVFRACRDSRTEPSAVINIGRGWFVVRPASAELYLFVRVEKSSRTSWSLDCALLGKSPGAMMRKLRDIITDVTSAQPDKFFRREI